MFVPVHTEAADEAEEEDAAPKSKKETQWSWDLLNDNKAIWLRNAKDVDEEEYDKFYQTLSKVQRESPCKCTHTCGVTLCTNKPRVMQILL